MREVFVNIDVNVGKMVDILKKKPPLPLEAAAQGTIKFTCTA